MCGGITNLKNLLSSSLYSAIGMSSCCLRLLPYIDRSVSIVKFADGLSTVLSHQDASNEIRVRKRNNFKATIGQSRNAFDVTKMGSLSSILYGKGLVYTS